MKLVTFDFNKKTAIGRLVGEEIVDLSIAAPELPRSMRALLNGGPSALRRARTAKARAGEVIPLSAVKLVAPIPNPSKFLAIGMNYRDHLEEAVRKGMKAPSSQLWFNKQVSCVTGPYDPILCPKTSEQLDYEAELGVVIGVRCRNVSVDHADEVIAGYTIVNDVSVRDWQMRSPTFTLGKSFDTHGPIGPCLVTGEDISDPHALRICLRVNGSLRQSGFTGNMIYRIHDQIAYLSAVMTLEPGDVLATGTPSGVGIAMDPPCFLKVGDVVRIDVDGIGYIENNVVADG